MRLTKLTFKMVGMAALLSTAIVAYAEPAPVYDADELDAGNYAQHDSPPPAPERAAPSVRESRGYPSSGSTESMSLSQRVAKMEQEVSNMTENTSAAHVESLQTQIQALRDQVEQLTRKLEQVQAEQKATYTDIDTRLSKINTAEDRQAIAESPVLPKPEAPKAVAKKAEDKKIDEQPDVAEEQQIYQTAYTLIKDKKYDEAVTTLQTMLKKYPRGQFASNAHYWLGELYGLVGKHDKSLSEFITVVTNYPKSPRVSDAQLKVGLIFASQSKWTEAKSAFKKVINRYPGTASARLASEQLKQIDKAGH